MIALAPLPQGGPPWLTVAGGVVALIVMVFGKFPVQAALEARRARREGMAARETEAREQTRQMRREYVELSMEALAEENERLSRRIEVREYHVGQLWDHVGALEAHIIDGKGAPPPRRPVLLDRPPGVDQWAGYEARGQR